jgi:2-hydroxychromene-2-carboxylate isomerase
VAVVPPSDADQPIFYYDLGSPDCYLVAERIMTALPIVPEWEPVLGRALGDGQAALDRGLIERRAAELDLQPVRWPSNWPPDTHDAMLAATYAKRVGRAVAFSLAAFRQVFAGGRDLSDQDTVLIAAAACEMHPTAVLKGIGLRSVGDALEQAGARARAAGVSALPCIQVGSRLFAGEDGVEPAARALEDQR